MTLAAPDADPESPDVAVPPLEVEWHRLRAQLDFAEGAWFGFVFSGDRRAVGELVSRVDQVLRQRVGRLSRRDVANLDELRSSATEVLRLGRGADVLWLDATSVVPPGDGDAEWEAAWYELGARLNGQRDTLLRDLRGGLVVSGPHAAKPVIRQSAPDLWSMRSLVIDLRPVASAEGLPTEGALPVAGVEAQQADLALRPDEATRGAKRLLDEAGTALRTSQPAVAVERAAAAVRMLEQTGAHGDALAVALTMLSRAFEANGDPPADAARRALALEPADTRLQAELLDRMGRSLARVADLAGARQAFAELVTVDRRRAEELGTPESLRHLSFSLNKLADIQREQDDLAAASAAYQESLDLRRRLAAELGLVEAGRDLSVGLERLGDIERSQGNLAAARKAYQESLDLRRRLEGHLGTPQAGRDLAIGLMLMGDVETSLGNLAAARAAYEEALQVGRRSHARPGSPEGLRDLTAIAMRLGDIDRAEGDLAAARARYEECVDVSRRMATEPSTPEALRDLAVSLERLGDIEQADGNPAAARAAHEESLDLRRRLAAQLGTPQAGHDLSISLRKLRSLYDQEGDTPGVEELDRKLRALGDRWPG